MNVTPSNHTQALRWLLSELHGGNSFTKDTLWTWLQQVSVVTNGQTTDRNVSVDAAHLRAILDFLHDSEADHYDRESGCAMSTVRETFGLCCPKCSGDDRLLVQITTFARISGKGTETFGDHEWSPESAAGCDNCDHWATVDAFAVRKGRKR